MEDNVQDDPTSFPAESHERFFTIKEVADLFQIDTDTVEDLIRQQRLCAVRVGKRTLRVSISALEDFIRANSTIPPKGGSNNGGPHAHGGTQSRSLRLGEARGGGGGAESSLREHAGARVHLMKV